MSWGESDSIGVCCSDKSKWAFAQGIAPFWTAPLAARKKGLKRLRSRSSPYFVALAMGTAILALYLYTLQPSLAWGDGTRLQREVITGESFILAELVDVDFAHDPYPFARLGVAAWDHPLYVMAGHLLVNSLPAIDSLWLVNLMSAVFAAASLVVFFMWLFRHTNSWTASLFATLALALSHTFWWHAVTPEVYTLFAFLMLLAIYFFDAYIRSGSFVMLAAAVLLAGLGTANHLLALLLLPPGAIYLALVRLKRGDVPDGSGVRIRPNLRYLIVLGAAFVVGLAPYSVQLLRVLRTFPINEVLGPAVGATFIRGSLATSPTELGASLAGYLIFLFYQFGPIGVAIGVYGWWQGRHDFRALWQMSLVFYAVYLVFGVVYGVSDQFAFFLAAHIFWAVAIGIGIASAEKALSDSRRRLLWMLLAIALLVVPLVYDRAPAIVRSAGLSDDSFEIPQIGTGVRNGLAYYLTPSKRGDRGASSFGLHALSSVPENSVIIAEWFTDTDEYFVLRYYASVEGLRPDVEIIGWPLEDPFSFDSRLVVAEVERSVPERPLYLASLSEEFYAASEIVERYCVVPENGLYRVYLQQNTDAASCLSASAVASSTEALLVAGP